MNVFILSLILPTSVALIVYIWINTNAFVDYFGWFLSKSKFPYFSEYIAKKKEEDNLAMTLEFPLWAVVCKPNFITKLISCPLCCSIWLNIVLAFLFGWWAYMLYFSFLSILMYILLRNVYKKV